MRFLHAIAVALALVALAPAASADQAPQAKAPQARSDVADHPEALNMRAEIDVLRADIAELKRLVAKLLEQAESSETTGNLATDDATTSAVADNAEPADTGGASTTTMESYPVVLVRPLPEDVADAPIPHDTVGSFIADTASWANSELAARGVRYSNAPAYELQGWLSVSEAGHHQIAIDVKGGDTHVGFHAACIASATVEGTTIFSESFEFKPRDGTSYTVAGGADLTPGLYATSIWVACAWPGRSPIDFVYTPLVMRPTDANLRPLEPEDVLHKAG